MNRRGWSFDYRLRCLVGGMPSMGPEGQGKDSQVASYRESLQVGPCAPKHGFMVWPCHPTDKAQCPSPSGASLRIAHPWAPFCMQSESGSQGQVSDYGNGCLHTASKSLLSSRPKRGTIAPAPILVNGWLQQGRRCHSVPPLLPLPGVPRGQRAYAWPPSVSSKTLVLQGFLAKSTRSTYHPQRYPHL